MTRAGGAVVRGDAALGFGRDPATWLERAREAIEGLDDPGLRRAWRRLDARLASETFTVALLGGAGRGKSTVVHRLLGEKVFPVGPSAPRIPCPVRVFHGPEPLLESTGPDGERARLPLEPEGWEPLSTDPAPAAVRVELPHPWLCSTGIHLVEVPADGGSSAESRERCLDAVSVADVALLVVSATAALGMAERELYEQFVLAPRIPWRMIVLTRFQEVPPGERRELLEYVEARAAAWDGDLSVAVLADAAGDDLGPGLLRGVEVLRGRIERWAADDLDGRRGRVERQLVEGLGELFVRVREALVEEEEALVERAGERRRKLQGQRHQLERWSAGFEPLLAELRRRRDRRLLHLADILDQRRERLSRDLGLGLEREADLRRWWNRTLPYLWRREMERISREAVRELRGQIAGDARWLARQAEDRLTAELDLAGWSSGGTEVLEGVETDQPAEREDLPRLEFQRWAIRVTSLALAVTSVSTFGMGTLGLYALMSAAPGLAAEPVMSHRLRERREALKQDLDREVAAELRRLGGALRSRVEEAYGQIEEAVRQEVAAGRRKRVEALHGTPTGDRARHRLLRGRIDEIDRWRSLLVEGTDGEPNPDREERA